MIKRWIYKPVPSTEDIERLSAQINVNPALSAILLQREIRDFETARKYFRLHWNNFTIRS